jgi:N-acetylglucosaminyldiphosphoundecaprenol N-acetyl-beta-D-mannosaminyltransferase
MNGEVFSLFDIPIQRLGFSESLHALVDASKNAAVRVFFVNAYSLVLSQEDRGFKRFLQLAEFCFSEGGAINIATRFLGEPPLPSNINSLEWVPALFDLIENDSHREKMSLFCLGGRREAVDTLSTEMISRWPNIKLVGHFHQEYDPEEEDGIVDIIEEKHPGIILLGMETRREEQFICRHWHRLKNSGVKIAIAGVQAIDAIAGTIPMTPRLARAIHLEWLLQMLLDPRRFYSRYLRGGPYFAWYLMKQKGMKEQK